MFLEERERGGKCRRKEASDSRLEKAAGDEVRIGGFNFIIIEFVCGYSFYNADFDSVVHVLLLHLFVLLFTRRAAATR